MSNQNPFLLNLKRTVGMASSIRCLAYVGFLATNPGSTESFLYQGLLSALVHRLNPLPGRSKWTIQLTIVSTVLTGITEIRLKGRCLGYEELSATKQRTAKSCPCLSTHTIHAVLRLHALAERSRQKALWTLLLSNRNGVIIIRLRGRWLIYEGHSVTEQRISRSYPFLSTHTIPAPRLLLKRNAGIPSQSRCFLIQVGIPDYIKRFPEGEGTAIHPGTNRCRFPSGPSTLLLHLPPLHERSRNKQERIPPSLNVSVAVTIRLWAKCLSCAEFTAIGPGTS